MRKTTSIWGKLPGGSNFHKFGPSATKESGQGRSLWGRLAGSGKLPVFVLTVLLSGIVVSCANGTYPLDIFYEMHYQQSYASHEPPRLSPPAGAVPTTGRPVFEMENPIPGQRLDEGARLYKANCVFCHGSTGNGEAPDLQGPVLKSMREKYNYGTDDRPYTITPDLTSSFVEAQNDLAVFGWITNGVTVMPAFKKLLTLEER